MNKNENIPLIKNFLINLKEIFQITVKKIEQRENIFDKLIELKQNPQNDKNAIINLIHSFISQTWSIYDVLLPPCSVLIHKNLYHINTIPTSNSKFMKILDKKDKIVPFFKRVHQVKLWGTYKFFLFSEKFRRS